jgi:hypothetical protein
MECIFFLFLMIFAVAWVVNELSEKNLDHRIEQALANNNFEEFKRLINLRIERQRKKVKSYRRAQADQRYLDAFLVLDAADDGIFVPGDENIFDELDPPEDLYYDDYQDEEGYYTDDW